MFSSKTVEEVRALPIAKVIGTHIILEQKGDDYKALSPFTKEKTPSFSVSPSKNIFKCFSTGKSGDGIAFVQEYIGCSFVDAVEEIANTHQIELIYQGNISEEKRKEDALKREEIKAKQLVLQFALSYFQSNPVPKEYLEERKVKQEGIDLFKLGYALPEKDAFYQAAIKAKYSKDILIKAGLIHEAKDGNCYDYFQDRCMFPHLDKFGKVVGFTDSLVGTVENKYNLQKYKYSPSSLWAKGEYLFGLTQAKKAIQEQGFAYLVEGQFDVITMSSKGIKNVVCIGSSSLSENQLGLLKIITQNITIIPDNDQGKALQSIKEKEIPSTLDNRIKHNAGILALHKNAEYLIENGFEVSLIIPQRENCKKDLDPDELFKEASSKETKSFLKGKQRYIDEYSIELCKVLSKTSPKEKANQIERLAQLIDKIADTNTRRIYFEEVAKKWSEFRKFNIVRLGDDNITKEVIDEINAKKTTPRRERKFWEHEGATFVFDKDGDDKMICDWTIALPYFISSHINPCYTCVLTRSNGETIYTIINTEDMNTKGNFRKFTERFGFVFRGTEADMDNMKEKQINDAVKCMEVSLLGQVENTYVFSNGIYYNGLFFQPDKYGIVGIEKPIHTIDDLLKIIPGSVVKYNGEDVKMQSPHSFLEKAGEENLKLSMKKGLLNYYSNIFIPCAQKIKTTFGDYEDPHGTLKKFKHNLNSSITFPQWTIQMKKVYGQNAIIGIGYLVMSLFRDHIYKANNSYVPNLFCFGPRQQGKSTFVRSLMCLFGQPAQPDGINLEQGTTSTSMNRTIASYRNGMIWFNEFKNTISGYKIGLLKGIADGSGKSIGLKTAGNETRTVTPLSTAVISGQHLPSEPALFSRCVMLEFDGTKRNNEAFDELKRWQDNS